MKKQLSFIFDKPLHGSVLAQEFFDILMMAAAFDQQVSLCFVGDGVYALLKEQMPEVLGMKNNTPLFDALALYDVDDIVVEKEALDERGLQLQQLVLSAHVICRENVSRKIAASDHVFSF